MTSPENTKDLNANFPQVGRWVVTTLPAGWLFVMGLGIREMAQEANAILANVALGEEKMEDFESLQDYILRQKTLILQYLKNATVAGPQLTPFPGAEESYLVIVRHTPEGGESMLHAQTYLRTGQWIGIVTLTTTEVRLAAVRPDYDAFLKGLRIRPVTSEVTTQTADTVLSRNGER